ncbi:precorrin-3B C(17)-methyltransferase [Geminicoccus roseus]|uniref:precorrin-3B C(17)-methyltransferase n=1 Tax=Geminicoccus roseus TaxID=404900 RepID=UPI00041B3942|nr:precorrin-3B C(17)-methyltransferase [Geminicoccus roseus]
MTAIVILGARSRSLAEQVAAVLPGAKIHAPAGCAAPADQRFVRATDQILALYRQNVPTILIGAAGIAIRAAAPALADKRAEPPLLAVAEDGSVVVPLLGGHRGANALARQIAARIGGQAAVTTAGDLSLGVALDEPPPGFACADPGPAKPITAHLLEDGAVALDDPQGLAGQAGLADLRTDPASSWTIALTHEARPPAPHCLTWHPRTLVLGVGCERNAPADLLVDHVLATLDEAGLAPRSIACIASIDLKADEPALAALAARLGVPARFFPAERLLAETDRLSSRSEIVFREVGCYGVAEGAALAAAGTAGRLLVEKRRGERVTCAVALAAAPLDPATLGQARGRLAVIGVGPGQRAWRTHEAEQLLERATDIVGYGLYLDLVADRIGHAVRHDFALGEEEARCRHALALAATGRDVALVCSGDAGIFAMASPLVELLEAPADPAWARIELVVAPGISAMQAASARLGAPLGHDFCAISLSDLLTPRPDIERRLHAAAQGDFVIAFYNPVSRRRRDLLPLAKAILLAHRPASTPVAIARSLGRSEEAIEVTTLQALDPEQVDMLSLVLVGSSNSRQVTLPSGRALVLTPRGYDRKSSS